MLEFKKRRFGIGFEYRWFADRPSPVSASKLVHYMQCAHPGQPLLGFINRKICVKVVDLRQSEQDILADMKSRTRTDIRRAQREGMEVRVGKDKQEFVDFYNVFAAHKSDHLPQIDNQIHWGENTLVLMVLHEGNILVMNHYVFSRAEGRARMVYSAALFRGVDSSEARNRIGRASRLIHYEAMLRFKRMGLRTYDFGEYAVNTDDESLQKVNRFKDCFGGSTEPCYKVQTLPLYLFSTVYGLIKRARSLSRLGGFRHAVTRALSGAKS